MDPQIIKLDKTTVNAEIGARSIDRTFFELIPKEDLVSVDQFFSYYNKLFCLNASEATIATLIPIFSDLVFLFIGIFTLFFIVLCKFSGTPELSLPNKSISSFLNLKS